MSVAITIICLACMLAAVFGLLKPIPLFGRRRRWAFLALVLTPFVLGPIYKASLTPTERQEQVKERAWKAEVAQMDAYDRGRPDLDLSYTWEAGCGGYCMSLSGKIQNNTAIARKDPKIRCWVYGESGTEIMSKTRTLYKRVPSLASVSFENLEMGIVSEQSAKARCEVEASGKAT